MTSILQLYYTLVCQKIVPVANVICLWKPTLNNVYYIPITDPTLELSVFWPSDTESRINELRFSESISLSFKTRLMSLHVPAFVATLRKVNCKHGTRVGKHVDVTSRNVTLWKTFPQFFGIKDRKQVLKSERMSEKGI